MTLAGNCRLPLFRQEFRYRHLWEWTTLAENPWTHNGRKLTRLDGFAELAEIFGTWERIFCGEFDGRRRKRVLVKIIGEKAATP